MENNRFFNEQEEAKPLSKTFKNLCMHGSKYKVVVEKMRTNYLQGNVTGQYCAQHPNT